MFDFFGKGTRSAFYGVLQQQAEAAHRAAVLMRQLTSDFRQAAALVPQIEGVRHQAHDLRRELRLKCAATFVTPLDKEDLEALATVLDQIANAIMVTALRIQLFAIVAPRPEFVEQARVLEAITAATLEAVTRLASPGDEAYWIELLKKIQQLEIEGDHLYRHGLAAAFADPSSDPLLAIKWKDTYDWMEEAIDRCLRAAEIIETILLKYA